jgi:hypothetical protein
VNVNLHIQKGKEYVWATARATAKSEKISLSELVTRAVIRYCTRNNVMLR